MLFTAIDPNPLFGPPFVQMPNTLLHLAPCTNMHGLNSIFTWRESEKEQEMHSYQIWAIMLVKVGIEILEQHMDYLCAYRKPDVCWSNLWKLTLKTLL